MFRFLFVLLMMLAVVIGCGDDPGPEDYVPEWAGVTVRHVACDGESIRVDFDGTPLISRVVCYTCAADPTPYLEETYLAFTSDGDSITFKPCADTSEDNPHIYYVRSYADEVLFFDPCEE